MVESNSLTGVKSGCNSQIKGVVGNVLFIYLLLLLSLLLLLVHLLLLFFSGQWGMPTVSASAVFGMLAGVMSSMIESVGDYYACASLTGSPPPPVHAVNRGMNS